MLPVSKSLLSIVAVALTAIACSDSSKNDSSNDNPAPKASDNKAKETKGQVVTLGTPVPPVVVVDPAPAENPALLPYIGWWTLTSYSCLKGALTKSAELENTLLSDAGLEVNFDEMKIVGGISRLQGKGKVTRRFEWTIEGTAAERKTKLILRTEDGKSGVATIKKKITLSDVTAQAKEKMQNIPEGGLKLQMVHGVLQQPAVNGIDVSQVSAFLASEIAEANSSDAIEKLKVSNFMKNILKGLTSWFAKKSDQLMSVTSTVEALLEHGRSKETVTAQFGKDTMSWKDSQLEIEDSAVTDVTVFDNTMCGADGKMVRNFTRFVP